MLERLAATRGAAGLYRLLNLLEAPEGAIVLFVPTEALADRLASHDLLATTVPQGASEWRDRYADPIRHVRVVAIPGNDELAEQQAAAVVASFRKRGVPAAVLRLDGLLGRGNLSDLLDAGGTPDRLLALAETALETPRQVERVVDGGREESDPARLRVVDPKAPLHIARQLLRDEYGATLRYCRGDFLRWDEGTYRPMENAASRRAIYL